MKKLLTISDLAKRLRVDRSTIYTYMNEKGLPYVVIGGRRRFRPDDVENWIEEQTKKHIK